MAPANDIGLWSRFAGGDFGGRGALFLDRDGVVIEETGYLCRTEDVRLISEAAAAIGRCNQAGIPVVMLTNQSGIGRGLYGWSDFEAVQDVIAQRLADAGARLDAVLACAYHADAQGPYRRRHHPWRKPNPGMLIEAERRMQLDQSRSWMVGDRASDIEAGRAAALAGGVIVETGYGRSNLEAALALACGGFIVERAATLAAAIDCLFTHGQLR
jgi:D-glycero-D-manno-heptose 1,7-bisphosphate phosphatase